MNLNKPWGKTGRQEQAETERGQRQKETRGGGVGHVGHRLFVYKTQQRPGPRAVGEQTPQDLFNPRGRPVCWLLFSLLLPAPGEAVCSPEFPLPRVSRVSVMLD